MGIRSRDRWGIEILVAEIGGIPALLVALADPEVDPPDEPLRRRAPEPAPDVAEPPAAILPRPDGIGSVLAEVFGRVVDEADGPLEGCEVRLDAVALRNGRFLAVTLTDASWNFRLRLREPLALRHWLVVVVRKDGFVAPKVRVAGARSDPEVVAMKAHALRAMAVSASSKEPVPGLRVLACPLGRTLPDGGQMRLRETTGPDASVRLRVPAGDLSVTGEGAGWWRETVKTRVAAGEESTARLELKADVTVRKTVLESGTARRLAGALVSWCHELDERTTSAEYGRFTALMIPKFQSIRFRSAWHAAPKGHSTLRDTALGSEVEWTFRLDPAGQIAGRVVDDRGAPVPGAFVSVERFTALSSAKSGLDTDIIDDPMAVSDERGEYQCQGVRVGDGARAHAVRLGHAEGRFDPMEVRAGALTSDVVVRLRAGLTVVLQRRPSSAHSVQRPLRGPHNGGALGSPQVHHHATNEYRVQWTTVPTDSLDPDMQSGAARREYR